MTASTKLLNETARIGEGIYTLSDVAQILGLDKNQVKYWVSEYARQKFLNDSGFNYIFGNKNLLTINFYSLIEIFVFYNLKKRNFSSSQIVKAHKTLSRQLNTKYPFAKAEILTSGKDILVEIEGVGSVKADGSFQQYIDIIKKFSQKIVFDDENRLPVRFYPLGKHKSIVVDPKHQFGQPVIKNTNIKVSTIYGHYKGGDSTEFISLIYSIPESFVKDAIKYSKAA